MRKLKEALHALAALVRPSNTEKTSVAEKWKVRKLGAETEPGATLPITRTWTMVQRRLLVRGRLRLRM